jgi:hypothetical protein
MQTVRKSLRLGASITAIVLGAALLPTPALAASCNWGGGSDFWTTIAKWSCGIVPGSGDAVSIGVSGSTVGLLNTTQGFGTLNLGGGNALTLSNSYLNGYGDVVNNGTVTIGNASRYTNQVAVANWTGTGAVVLDDTTNYAQIYGNTINFGAGQTIRGSGLIGLNGTSIGNAGLISADVSGRTITIDPVGGNGTTSFINTGIVQATNSGTIVLETGGYDNSGGIIRATSGGTVVLNNDVRIIGGTLSSDAASTIGASNQNQYLQNVTLANGTRLNLNNDFIYVSGTLANNGTVTLANASRLSNEGGGDVVYGGTGGIVLDNSSNYAQIYGAGGKVTFNQNITGSGQIGLNGTLIVNNATISAQGGTGISIDATGGSGGTGAAGTGIGADTISALVNNSVIQASGSTLAFEAGRYDNNNGTIRAISGGTIVLNNDVRIIGGTLSSDATSTISAFNQNQYLQNITLANGTKLSLNNDYIYVNGTLTNNGLVTLTNASRLANEVGDVVYSGTGNIVLDNSSNYAQIYGAGSKVTLNQNVTGSGQIGLNGTLIVNNATITAQGGTGIDIDATGGSGGTGGAGVGADTISGLVNNGTIEAIGSTVAFEAGRYDNVNGTIRAISGGTIVLNNDVRIIGGTLSTDATSSVSAFNQNQYLQNVTLANGTKLNLNNDYVYVNGTLTNNGTVTLANASQLRNEVGDVVYGGAGSIVLDNSSNYAQIYGTGNKTTFNQNVTGSGQIGLNGTLIVNNALISAQGGTGISIDATGGSGGTGGAGIGADTISGLVNNSIMQANGSTLAFEGGRYDNNNGTIRAINNGTIVLNNDARIIGGTLSSDATSTISAFNQNQYLQNVTLANGTRLNLNNDFIYTNGALTNNGTVTVANASQLRNEVGDVVYGGSGSIVLDNSTNYAQIYGAGSKVTFNQNVTGSGQIGLNGTLVVNNALISAQGGTGISIDASGGNGGLSGAGVGTGGNAGLYNTGTIQAAAGSTLALEGGLYENGRNGPAIGGFAAIGAGSTFVMNGDASLYNLQAGGVLNQGSYASSTGGAASTLNLRSNASDAIVTIGTGAVGTDTIVKLDGVNSNLNVLGFSSSAPRSIDSTLTTIAHSGELVLSNGRVLTITAGGGAFSNDGQVQLVGGTIGATSFTNTGFVNGNGTVTVAIANSGNVQATGGVLTTRAINGSGILSINGPAATLDLTAATGNSSAGVLFDTGGTLALGTHNVTITSDYLNTAFGSGNAFNAHANVTGTGLILAANATQTLSGPGLSGTTLNVGNVRTGGSSATTLTITNNGTSTNLIGAVQNSSAPSVALTGADFQAAHGGGTATVGISYTGLTAGSLAGQTLKVVNNFDNVASATLNLAGNIYQVAQAGAQPASVTLGARRVGDAPAGANLTIANTAPVTPGFNEALVASASTGSGFTLNGGTTANATVAAGASTVVVLGHGTATAGAFTSTVAIGNTSQAVAGSGLADLALAGQSVAVSQNIYATAVASVSPGLVDFGTVRQGAISPTGSVGVTNGASGALTDNLVTTLGALPTGVSATTTPGPLAAGASGTVGFALNTGTAGTVSGTSSLNFASHDGELADVALLSKSVSFSGTVTQLAIGSLFKSTGTGAFSGSGTSYTLNLGSLASGSGSYGTNLGVSNTNGGFAFSETLGGSFAQGAGTGYSFTGASFAGLVGGTSLTGDVLSFDTTGLGVGTYSKSVTLNGFSRYAGLSDFSLSPITLTISAQVTGGAIGGVPEPANWAMMLTGFGLIGMVARRRRTATPRVAA